MPTRVITFSFSAAADRHAWTPDFDGFVIGGSSTSTANAALVSPDPSLTTTLIATPTSESYATEVIFYQGGNTRTQFASGLKIPISAGTKYYLSVGGAMSLFLFVESAEIIAT